eukprot:364743-Chlamydomonas_euryale.AAC.59
MREKVYLVGCTLKSDAGRSGYGIEESLEELGRLADTAGLKVKDLSSWNSWCIATRHLQNHKRCCVVSSGDMLQVVGSTYQILEIPNNSTYIGSGKVVQCCVNLWKICLVPRKVGGQNPSTGSRVLYPPKVLP